MLIYQTSLSTNDAAINKNASEFGFVTNETVYTITNAGADSLGNTYIFIPAVITSLGSETDISAPTFPSLSIGSLDVTYSTFDSGSPDYAITVLTNLNFDGLSAFLATSASSAAVSAVASGGVYRTGGVEDITKFIPDSVLSALLNEVQDISPLIQVNVTNGTSIASDPVVGILDSNTTPAFLVTPGNSLLRLADGAYVDNTSVTSGLTYLQANNLISNFTATALTFFDGADPNLVKINPGYGNIGKEAAVLFTDSDQNQTYSIVNVSHPSAAVFDAKQTTGLDEPVWQYSGSDGFKLDYFKLGVTTAVNNMGIAVGEHGTLNLWVVTTTAEALPSLDQSSWDQYTNLYNQIITGLQFKDNGHTGAQLLAYSLGLDSDFEPAIDSPFGGIQTEFQFLGGLLL